MLSARYSFIHFKYPIGKQIVSRESGFQKSPDVKLSGGAGVARHFPCDVETLARFVQDASPHFMATVGNPKVPFNAESGLIVVTGADERAGYDVMRRKAERDRPEAFAAGFPIGRRTEEFFEFSRNRSYALVDADRAQPLDWGGPMWSFPDAASVRDALIQAAPMLASAPMVGYASSSGFIFDEEGNEIFGASGWHLPFMVDSGVMIHEVLRALHDMCIVAGVCWPKIEQNGTISIKTPVDLRMLHPEQPIFVGGMLLPEGLTQRRPEPVVFHPDGLALDSRAFVALRPSQEAVDARSREIQGDASLAELAEAMRASASQGRGRSHVTVGGAIMLELDEDLHFDQFGWVTVADVVNEPDRFLAQPTLADPHYPHGMSGDKQLERNIAVLRRAANGLTIFSHKQGGVIYRLPRAHEYAEAVLAELSPDWGKFDADEALDAHIKERALVPDQGEGYEEIIDAVIEAAGRAAAEGAGTAAIIEKLAADIQSGRTNAEVLARLMMSQALLRPEFQRCYRNHMLFSAEDDFNPLRSGAYLPSKPFFEPSTPDRYDRMLTTPFPRFTVDGRLDTPELISAMKRTGQACDLYVLTLASQAAVHAEAVRQGVPVRVIRGRSSQNLEGHDLCRKKKTIQVLRSLGLRQHTRKYLCEDREFGSKCPHLHWCRDKGYLSQWQGWEPGMLTLYTLPFIHADLDPRLEDSKHGRATGAVNVVVDGGAGLMTMMGDPLRVPFEIWTGFAERYPEIKDLMDAVLGGLLPPKTLARTLKVIQGLEPYEVLINPTMRDEEAQQELQRLNGIPLQGFISALSETVSLSKVDGWVYLHVRNASFNQLKRNVRSVMLTSGKGAREAIEAQSAGLKGDFQQVQPALVVYTQCEAPLLTVYQCWTLARHHYKSWSTAPAKGVADIYRLTATLHVHAARLKRLGKRVAVVGDRQLMDRVAEDVPGIVTLEWGVRWKSDGGDPIGMLWMPTKPHAKGWGNVQSGPDFTLLHASSGVKATIREAYLDTWNRQAEENYIEECHRIVLDSLKPDVVVNLTKLEVAPMYVQPGGSFLRDTGEVLLPGELSQRMPEIISRISEGGMLNSDRRIAADICRTEPRVRDKSVRRLLKNIRKLLDEGPDWVIETGRTN